MKFSSGHQRKQETNEVVGEPWWPTLGANWISKSGKFQLRLLIRPVENWIARAPVITSGKPRVRARARTSNLMLLHTYVESNVTRCSEDKKSKSDFCSLGFRKV